MKMFNGRNNSYQLTINASVEDIQKAGLGAYYTDHPVGLNDIL
ncbi:MAG: hypothetical protein RR478_05520 [Bacilli bacterium]